MKLLDWKSQVVFVRDPFIILGSAMCLVVSCFRFKKLRYGASLGIPEASAAAGRRLARARYGKIVAVKRRFD